jgi:V/A-type H+-transporting ATPase subunit D
MLVLRRELVTLEHGHDLLERKRELLARLVRQRLSRYRELRQSVAEALRDAYHWVTIVHMRMGSVQLRQAVLGQQPLLSIHILPRSTIGVEYPTVSVEVAALKPIGLMWTDSSFDEARARMASAGALLAQLGEAESALARLLTEQRKTQKRVNALKFNLIPRYRDTLRYIEATLSEEERNALFQLKILREMEFAARAGDERAAAGISARATKAREG